MEIITNREIEYYNLDSAGKVALATAGIGAATAIGGGLLSKQKTLSEVQQKCGKRPLIRGRKRDEWQKCSDRFNQSLQSPPPSSTPVPIPNSKNSKPMSKSLKMGLIIGGSVLGLTLIGLLVYRLSKQKK